MSNYQYCNNFINSQYEGINGGRFLFREHVNAKYIKQEDTNCKGNLLIEALPPTQNLDQIFDFLKKFPEYSEEERNFSNEYRMHAIFRLLDFFMPLSANLLTSEYLSIIMRRGYIDKKIGTPSYVKLIRNANEDLINNNSYDLITSVVSNPSNGFLVIGASGGGKTTGLNNSLSYYPQVIHHVIDNDGLRGYFTQIPWVRIDCSNDGKIPGVCNNFFEEIDRLLGTNYINQYGNHSTISKMINSIRFLTLKYAVGVLVVDEIQHIGNTIGGEQLLNFFVTLTNMIKIPIVYIGTYKASKTILGNQYRQGRKAEGIGVAEYRILEQDSKEWDIFIEGIWNYQWVKYKTPLTNEIKKIMHCRTIGIIDRVIKLFMAVQLEAIISKIETITPELINEVADEKFPLTEEMINAFKSSNIDKIGQYEDIKAQDLALSSYINRNLVNEKILEIYKSEKFEQNKIKEATINDIIFRICSLTQFKKEEVKNAAVAFCNINGFNKDIDFLVGEVYKILVEQENGTDKNKKVSKNKKNKKSTKLTDNFDENKKDILKEFSEGMI